MSQNPDTLRRTAQELAELVVDDLVVHNWIALNREEREAVAANVLAGFLRDRQAGEAKRLERLRAALEACYYAADRPPHVAPFMDSCNEVRHIALAALADTQPG